MQPTILFEDKDILVLDKPSGMTVNKADTTKGEETVQDFTEKKLAIIGDASSIPQKTQAGEYNPEYEFVSRGGIVHRLDKETSGILIVAKNPESFAAIKKQFMERMVKKIYTALTHGRVQPADGEINVPMGRLSFNRKRFGVIAGGRESRTLYKTLHVYTLETKNGLESLSLLQLFPQTGRTHQIRVHLKHINHPIFADELYGGRKTARDDRKLLPRLFLHASEISLHHPTTGETLHITSPLPSELSQFLQTLV